MSKTQKPQLSEEDQMIIWRQQAIEQQGFYCDMLSDRDWESYTDDKTDLIHLQNKIGYVLFGSPPKDKDQDDGIRQVVAANNKEYIHSEKKEYVSRPNCTVKGKSKHIEKGNTEKNIEHFLSLLLDNETPDFTQSTEFLSFFNLEKTPEIIMETYSDDVFQDEYSSEDDDQPLVANASQAHLNNSTDDADYYKMYYSEPDQIKQINDLIGQIKLCSGLDHEMRIAFIFVIAKIDTNVAEFPIIRVFNFMQFETYFVDPTGRCYKSWTDFLEDNFFPSCVYCYPKNGFYTTDINGKAMIEFALSPEAGFKRKFSKYTDFTTSLVGLCCGAVAVASLAIPVAGPLLVGSAVAGGSSGLWSAGRAAYQLIDRSKHEQGLFDKESRGCWITMAAGILGAASMGALSYTTYLARNGKVIGKAASLLVNGVEIGNAGISGLSVLHQGYNIYENRRITFSDGAELALSLLFFCNSAVRFRTAQTILIEAQSEVISGIESQLSRSQKRSFRKLAKSTANINRAEGNACVIKTVMNLDDPQTYFKQLNRIRKTANKTKSTITFREDASGMIKINGKVSVEPEVINSMSNKTKQKMFNSSNKFNQNKINSNKFNREMKFVSKKENLVFTKRSCEFQKKMNMKVTSECQSDGKKLFSDVKTNNVKDFNTFFSVIKNDDSSSKVKLLLMDKIKNSKDLNPLDLIIIILNICRRIPEAKELYHKLMKFYEDNLRDSFEKFAEDVERKWRETCNEQNENCQLLKNLFFRDINKNDFSPWDYFEYCLQQLQCEVPDKIYVIIVPQKVGWLFLCDDPRVHSVFVAVVRVGDDVEKITCTAMMKNELSDQIIVGQ